MSDCPCGSGEPYQTCCRPFHDGDAWPQTAEALMRARYSAYVKADIAFIENSTHPDAREDFNPVETRRWAERSEWLGLELRRVEGGDAHADEGTVEFVARYRRKDNIRRHHELAVFGRHEGRWHFVDGRAPPVVQAVRSTPKVGRNEPCPCGSGKKYKRCCGA